MNLATLTSFLWLINLTVRVHSVEDAAPGVSSTTPPSAIDIIIPNRVYVLKIDCISCPFLTRRSNSNEWETDPRPNQLVLPFYIDSSPSRLYLGGKTLNPLWYERRAPSFYSLPHPFAPPFVAEQIDTNKTARQQDRLFIREFELAYEYDMVTYAPKDRVREWEVLIEFEITGLRHEEHVPKDIPFFDSGMDRRTEGAVPGVTSVVRLVLGYTDLEEMIITALELMPKDSMAKLATKVTRTLREATELKGDKSITSANWGGRLRDINGPDGKYMYTEHVSFKPGEWNDCGRKDEWGRQIMCKMDDLKAWSSIVFVMSLISVGIVLIAMFVSVVFVSWLAVRFLRGKRSEEVVTAEGENDALLLFRDEEHKEEDEKVEKEIMDTQTLHQIVHLDERRDTHQSGPCDHNLGNHI